MFEKAIEIIMAEPTELHYPAYFVDLLRQADVSDEGAGELISKQAVIDELYDWSNHTMTDAETWHLRQVIGDIKSMPSIQPEPRWIPVSKRLPDVDVAGEIEVMGYDGQVECINATYLISKPVVAKGRDGKPIIAIYEVDDDERKYWINDADGTITDGITEWMPLPESYKGDERDV